MVSRCEPLGNVYVGAIILERSPGKIAAPEVGTADFPWQAGVDVDLRRRLGEHYQLQVRFFGIDAWDEDSLLSPDGLQFNYLSSLHSTEVNLRRRWADCLTVLGGFRWIELGEETAELPGKGDPIITNNHLYGGQLGALNLGLLRPTAHHQRCQSRDFLQSRRLLLTYVGGRRSGEPYRFSRRV